MSIKKIPNQIKATKVSNIDLLPSVNKTEPNKKMLTSSLDLVTSKGQMLPFNQTYGLKVSNENPDSFFIDEKDDARRESQTNSAFIVQTDDQEYTGKTSYLDIHNYFNVKNFPLKSSSGLDVDTLMLDLPIGTLSLTNYDKFYWIAQDLPIINVNLPNASFWLDSVSYDSGDIVYSSITKKYYKAIQSNQNVDIFQSATWKEIEYNEIPVWETATSTVEIEGNIYRFEKGDVVFSKSTRKYYKANTNIPENDSLSNQTLWTEVTQSLIRDNIIGKSTAKLLDAITDKQIELKTGMRFSFNGFIDADYKFLDDEVPKVFYVKGSGTYISLININDVDNRIPYSYFKKVPWDNSEFAVIGNVGWGGNPANDSWDSSIITLSDPEYIVQDRYVASQSPWGLLNKWYHINLIRYVANILDLELTDIASVENKAKRPIINFYGDIELANWPKRNKGDVAAFLKGNESDYYQKSSIVDYYGYTVQDQDIVVVENSQYLYRAIYQNNKFQLSQIFDSTGSIEGDGYIITGKASGLYHRLLWKNNKWQPAQNKISKNQAPKFVFYKMDDTNLEELIEDFEGGIILDFKSGNVYDSVLERYIALNDVDYELVNISNSMSINSNQILMTTESDATFLTPDNSVIIGPYKFNISTIYPRLETFWDNRSGINLNKETQYILYDSNDQITSYEINDILPGFNEIHLFHSSEKGVQLYYNVPGMGYVNFTTNTSAFPREYFIPLISGLENKIICHDLPYEIEFYKSVLDTTKSSISNYVSLESPEVTNNNIKNGTITLNISADDIQDFAWSINFSYGKRYFFSIARPVTKWRFIQTIYLQDKTYPIYEDYDFNIEHNTNENGDSVTTLNVTNSFIKKAKDGDKIIIESYSDTTEQTAPISLTRNPMNEDLTTISYYALYQHLTSIYSTSLYGREYIDSDPSLTEKTRIGPMRIGVGTLNKHNNPLVKTAIMATQMPFDFTDILIKQGKHYDLFYTRLRTELEKIASSGDSYLEPINVLNLALQRIYVNSNVERSFWNHSNMVGWGTDDNYNELTSSGNEYIVLPEPISYEAGKEYIVHLLNDTGHLLMRNVDYEYVSDVDDYYTRIKLSNQYTTQTVRLRQWLISFDSRVPASLAKIGLAPVYKPEIYLDTTLSKYFMYRHDGTRHYLKFVTQTVNDVTYDSQLDANGNPLDFVDAMLYEYEKAVWSSISYNVENNDFAEYNVSSPGGFRSSKYTWDETRYIVNTDIVKWMVDNSILVLSNNTNSSDPFEYRYTLASEELVEGSWRAVYRYFYDTDRPHTHPWEMLGYTIKPTWWDTYYSWTDSDKRIALERALRYGSRVEPIDGKLEPIPYLSRVKNVSSPEQFPVDTNGELLPPTELSWLTSILSFDTSDWQVGDFSNYDLAFLSTQTGVASETKLRFLMNPTTYVNNNWIPGNTIKVNGFKFDKSTNYWITPTVDSTSYHGSVASDGTSQYTAGIESLYSEFCVLNNVDFYSNVIEKFNNISIKKEFLLQGFTNKNNVKIQSTSISNQSTNLFVPEENYQVRTVKHYPNAELFYSGMKIIWNGQGWIVYNFTNENPFFNYFKPKAGSGTRVIKVQDTAMYEKILYDKTVIHSVRSGEIFTNRQDLYDFILGYGLYLESLGFKFDGVEGGDLRNWQLSAKQFITWSNDTLAPGNFIDLNPSADEIILDNTYGQFENLIGTNTNPGLCVDRNNKPLFSKDLLVSRGAITTVKTKDPQRNIYGIKFTFVQYESVIHLDSISIFNDTYFLPKEGTTKRSFVVGGKKSDAWTGEYFIPGYLFSNGDIIPNYDTISDLGRNLLDFENTILDETILDASRAQFGLDRNAELAGLFLTSDTEDQFKSSITFEKGTRAVFSSLEPLTHKKDTGTTEPNEEYMIRAGEFGNIENSEIYEFELHGSDIKFDKQIIKLSHDPDPNRDFHYVKNTDWVYTHKYGRGLTFRVDESTTSILTSQQQDKLPNLSPIVKNDTDYVINSLDDLPALYEKLAPLYTIESYSPAKSYRQGDKFRYNGYLYTAIGTIPEQAQIQTDITPAAAWPLISDKVREIPEPYLPNVYVSDYKGTGWNILQLTDSQLAIDETCPGETDTNKARIVTKKPHNLSPGDQLFIVNANTGISSVNGQWEVAEVSESVYVGDGVEASTALYIDTKIIDTINDGKIFAFKPARFNSTEEMYRALSLIEDNGQLVADPNSTEPLWIKKFNPVENVNIPLTPSGFPSNKPLVIVSNDEETSIYIVDIVNETTVVTLVEQTKMSVDTTGLRNIIVYDHVAGRTIGNIELFDPKKLIIPAGLLREIDSISRVDPARYNRSSDPLKAAYQSAAWYDEKVGYRWWDTSTLSLVDYSIGSEEFKLKNWGKTVDNKLPDVYEWTKSPVPPQEWAKLVEQSKEAFGEVASGEAYIDQRLGKNLHWTQDQDAISGKTFNVYYFWVKNKKFTSKSEYIRQYPVSSLSKVLLNPDAAGISWWAPISNNAIIVKGIKQYLNDTSTVVQVRRTLKGNNKNQQWLLISESESVKEIPEWMHIRLRNSLSGYQFDVRKSSYSEFDINTTYKILDIVKYQSIYYIMLNPSLTGITPVNDQGQLNAGWDYADIIETYDDSTVGIYNTSVVPNRTKLHKFNLLGNEIRPYAQSWFDNNVEARRTLIREANKLLKNIDLTVSAGWDSHLSNTNFVVGNSVVDLTTTWEYVDFESTDFDSTKPVVAVVQSIRDIPNIFVPAGTTSYIEVLDLKSIIEKDENNIQHTVYRTNGTIRFIEEAFKLDNINSWDIASWDSTIWDQDIGALMFAIVDAMRYDLFVGTNRVNYNKVMVVMLRYILSEQLNVDWIQKASTIKPTNLIGSEFDKTPEMERDQVSTLINFYSSVKSYRDKLRNSNLVKNNNEDIPTLITDTSVITTIMRYNRFGDIENPADVVSGTEFSPIGWDTDPWDNTPITDWNANPGAPFSSNQSSYDYLIDKEYNGIDADGNILSGRTKRDLKYNTDSDELVRVVPSESLILDVEQYNNELYSKVRMYQYMGIVGYFILDSELTGLVNAVTQDANTIEFTNMLALPDASVDNIQYVWINNEKIGYTIKTETGISGLIRGAHGTSACAHEITEPVYPETAKTVIVSPTNIMNLNLPSQFLNDNGATLHESTNPIALAIKNYISS